MIFQAEWHPRLDDIFFIGSYQGSRIKDQGRAKFQKFTSQNRRIDVLTGYS